MSDNTFDREIDDAWTELQDRLTGYVHVMEDDDELVLQSQYDSVDDGLVETAACVRFFAWAGDKVRCEVPSNRFLHPARALTEEEHDRLIELGWNRPDLCEHVDEGNGSASYYRDADREDAHLLASMTVTVFREIWDLLHPSFLKAITGGRGETPEFGTADVPAQLRDGAGLRDRVDAAVESMLEQAPGKDADGDILVWVGDLPTYVRVIEEDARVEVFARVVHTISDRTRTAEALADLNRQWPDIKFLLIVDNVVAVMRVDGSPFVADHLVSVFRMFEHFVDTVDDAFAEKLGGKLNSTPGATSSYAEHECEDEFPAALVTLIHLDSESGLDPDDVAEICGRDRDTILEFLRLCTEQEIEWRHNAELAREEEPEEADMCEDEASAWAKTKESLRAALRVVVLPNRTPPRGGFQNLG
ncbi:T3SS (YopN, CesT) and YbjN peptide-binding chaperone 1 [Rhodococcus opacus]|uniref:T3SS (YopN, CesT) and YbjN peptide-binding chaperone 1 n=1 Tax=Rhodococcus opacus TaxID=37919 RepID=UPI002236A552|nr:hypothetical protein [Rhodococcus opacus]UZG55530.1 hypothetical protein ONE62_36930 [Rhodococcus opacus]